jgi:hypothetical protein
MNSHREFAECATVNAIGTLGEKYLPMEKNIRVLSVGQMDRGVWIHSALSNEPNSRHIIATDYRQLWELLPRESVHVAILDYMLSTFELEAACRLIRRRWPHAKILIVRRAAGSLDDALYDDRVAPTVTQEVLFSAVERLTEEGDQIHSNPSILKAM